MAAPHISQEHADEFAIGALEPESERLIALHAADCASCRGVIAEAQRVASAFALGGTKHRAAPTRLRRRTFAEAGISRPGPVEVVTRWARAVAGVAAVLVAAGAFTGMVILRDQIDDLRAESNALEGELGEVRSQRVEIAALTRQIQDQEKAAREISADASGNQDLLVALMSPETWIAELSDVSEGDQAIGRLVWDPAQKRLWVVAADLTQRPVGQTYQIWVNADGQWQSIGTFNSDTSGFVRYQQWVPQGLEGYESAVVTIEKAGGSPERSGESVFVADLSSLRK